MFFVYTFFASDFVGKIVMLLLIAASFYSVAIIFKYGYFFYLHDMLGENLTQYVPQMKRMVKLNTDPSMFLDVYDHVLSLYIQHSDRYVQVLKEKGDELQQSTEMIYIKWETKVLRDIDNLSIIGSIAPFIGLFGTVLGIMSSFQAIAKANSNSITVVAPALSEALLVTALGIFVAIPANVAANYFYSKLECTRKKLLIFKDLVVKQCIKGESQ